MNKILIVDDDTSILLLFKEELKYEGYTVEITSDCHNLMEKIASFMPDIVILDIMMDKFNGLDILQKIRQDYYDMPVILCSVSFDLKYDSRSIAADYYVTKSSDLNELKIMIKRALVTCKTDFECVLHEVHEVDNCNINEM